MSYRREIVGGYFLLARPVCTLFRRGGHDPLPSLDSWSPHFTSFSSHLPSYLVTYLVSYP